MVILVTDALPCPKDHKCGEHSTCVVDPLFPNTTECRCDQGYKKSVDGKCLGKFPKHASD